MIFFLHGQEDFLIKREIKKIREKFLQQNPSASVEVFDFGESSEVAKLHAMISNGGGLFSEKKMVVISEVFNQNEKIQERVLEIFEQLTGNNKNISIVISEGQIKQKKGKLFRFFSKNGKDIEYKKLDAKKIVYWIGEEVGKRSQGKVAINLSAQNRLVQISRNDLWKISNEIDKLITHKLSGAGGGTTITSEDVDLLCQGEIESKVFDLVDALGSRNKPRAMELLKNIIAQGENEFYVFSMFLYQLRNLAVVIGLKEKFGVNPQLISQKAEIHPYVAKKTLDQSRNFSKKHIKRLFDLAAQLDCEVKGGIRDNMQDALVYFVAKS